jgi:hypothetical protein
VERLLGTQEGLREHIKGKLAQTLEKVIQDTIVEEAARGLILRLFNLDTNLISLGKEGAGQVRYKGSNSSEHFYKITFTWSEDLILMRPPTKYGTITLDEDERGYSDLWVCVGKKGTPNEDRVRILEPNFSKDPSDVLDVDEKLPGEE